MKIFIGTEPKTEIARKVLEVSIRRRTASPLEFTSMLGPAWTYDTKGITVGTGFSLRRWLIPSYCAWQGRAIYLDADQLVFGDIAELEAMPERVPAPPSTSMWCTYQPDKFSKKPWPQTSVMVIDCVAAKLEWGWDRDMMLAHLRSTPGKKAYVDFMHALWCQPVPQVIPTVWNHLNVFEKGYTKLLHYTKEDAQPWYVPTHPQAPLWEHELNVALELGAVTRADLEEALSRWQVREDWRQCNGLHPHYRKFLARAK